jgi:hypothetical protein
LLWPPSTFRLGGAGKGIMLRKKDKQPVQPEPADPPVEAPVEIPAPAPPDPIVRAILVGPSSPLQTHLVDLISATPRFEVLDRFDLADRAMGIAHSLPARRRIAMLIDAKLPEPHDAGWLIRRLRELHPTLRLFAYAEPEEESLMEHVALAGVDEILVIEGPESDREVLDAFVRQFDLASPPEQPFSSGEVPVEHPLPAVLAPPVVADEAPVEPLLPAEPAPVLAAKPPAEIALPAAPAPVVPAEIPPPTEPAAVVAEDIPPQPPTPNVPVEADAQPRPHETPTEVTPAPIDAASLHVGDPATRKRGRFHKRGGAPRKVKEDAQEVESAAVRNLERELAGVRKLSPEATRLAVTHEPLPSTRAAEGRPRSKETDKPSE